MPEVVASPAPSLTGSSCWACGEPVVATVRLPGLPYVECPRCGLLQRPAPEARASEHYTRDDYAGTRAEEFIGAAEFEDRRRDARVRLAYVRARGAAGRLLDVGTAGGAFVLEAAHAGFDAAGIEPSPSFARYARDRLGLDVRPTTLEQAELPDGELDVMTLWHVLEHLADPVEPLRRAHRALRAGGTLAVEVPNAGSGMARAMGLDWPMLEPEVHLGQYCPAALGALLERAGFRVMQMSTVSTLAYLPWRARLTAGALAHRAKWRGRQHELLRATAIA